jgi:hypothetical protein
MFRENVRMSETFNSVLENRVIRKRQKKKIVTLNEYYLFFVNNVPSSLDFVINL